MSTVLLPLALAVAVVAAARGVWSPCGLSMLSSLNPVSETARGHRFWVTAAWYVAGAVAGGALLGAGLAVAALGFGRLHVDGQVLATLVLAAAAVCVASDTRMFGRSLPVHPRQVDERWLTTYRRWIYAGGFGLQIGTGFATYIMTAGVYLTAALAALTAGPGPALLVGLVFGGVRGLAILVATRARTPEALRALMAAVDRSATASLVCVTAVAAAAGAFAAGVLGGPVAAGAAALVLGAATVAGRGRVALPGRLRQSTASR